MQGHKVVVVLGGAGAVGGAAGWGRDLPGLAAGAPQTQGKQEEGNGGGREGAKRKEEVGQKREKMKIAWRYERLGEFGGRGGLAAGSRGTKHVSFPALSSLVYKARKKREKNQRLFLMELLCKTLLFYA